MSEPRRIGVADTTLLQRANDIMELLQRAKRLGYSVTLGPEQMTTLIAILEEARLTKPVTQ